MTTPDSVVTPAGLLTGRTRWVEHHMNTTVTLAGDINAETAHEFFASIAADEARFSRFLPDSELSRFARDEIAFAAASSDLHTLLNMCETLRASTDGAFEFEPRRRSGRLSEPVLDPNAYAKGWIVGRALRLARQRGARNIVVNAGGDVVVAGLDADSPMCRVGIRHPHNPQAVVATLAVRDCAIATSGTYERGGHIRQDTASKAPASVTVMGPDLGIADALSTAVFSQGAMIPPWWDGFADTYDLMIIDEALTMMATAGFAAVLVQ